VSYELGLGRGATKELVELTWLMRSAEQILKQFACKGEREKSYHWQG